ncbi:unnamed protein product [Dovyalis caffra]|uniref:Uncharacterized protein n=1 Tax=Dovyalis caffra TaxID=77055 RepID=A0AAV1SLP1_9ROSI|nr:unnamed protein product [Dovyalis caffra]
MEVEEASTSSSSNPHVHGLVIYTVFVLRVLVDMFSFNCPSVIHYTSIAATLIGGECKSGVKTVSAHQLYACLLPAQVEYFKYYVTVPLAMYAEGPGKGVDGGTRKKRQFGEDEWRVMALKGVEAHQKNRKDKWAHCHSQQEKKKKKTEDIGGEKWSSFGPRVKVKKRTTAYKFGRILIN